MEQLQLVAKHEIAKMDLYHKRRELVPKLSNQFWADTVILSCIGLIGSWSDMEISEFLMLNQKF